MMKRNLLLVALSALASSACSTNPAAKETCLGGAVRCGATCVNAATDQLNCGACGNVCSSSQSCQAGACVSACLTQSGPGLNTNIAGWPNSGLQFTALRNTTLMGFTFVNQGVADTISLMDGGVAVQTLAVPAGAPLFGALVNWPLTAGHVYQLINANGNNGLWTSFGSFPVSNASIRVDATFGNGTTQTGFWFSYVDLFSCP